MESRAEAAIGVQGGAEPTVVARAPKTREEVVNSEEHRDLGTPKLGVGDPAIDFSLPVLDPQHGLTDRVVRLSDYAGQSPVALIFGSYT